ncbi:MAG TPA: HDIG domain-containing protein [bacterium]|nr:HDIG domain-containing protein [bacterium]HOL47583.1 HDIG domain-containing protein [bacterium]HPQ18845.1 HDIG domain-containing protein [bacterium]
MSKYGISREEAIELLNKYIKNQNLIKHCLATEAVMKELAKKFNEDKELWRLTGLLHDLDVELTNGDLNIHTLETEKILKEKGVDERIIRAIKRHNEIASKEARETRLEIALAAGETITGLIIATTLVYPDKKIASVKSKSIIKRMKEKSFAASVNREIIKECEKIGIALEEFAEISLKAMQEIAGELGL